MNIPHVAFAAFIFVMLSAAAACNNASDSKTGTRESAVTQPPPSSGNRSVFEKLVGTWQSQDGKNFETWSTNGQGGYLAKAYSVQGSDTAWNEEAVIYPENNSWVFENTVKGQNSGHAIRFISSVLRENRVQFSNPAHDFPTDINYTLADVNTLHAYIVGPNRQGGKDTIPFFYKRIVP